MAIRLSFEELRGLCAEESLEGGSLDELCAQLAQHARSVHGWEESDCNDPDHVARFRGAIKQTARPATLRGMRLDI